MCNVKKLIKMKILNFVWYKLLHTTLFLVTSTVGFNLVRRFGGGYAARVRMRAVFNQ